MPRKSIPLFGQEEEAIIAKASEDTYAALQAVATTKGATVAIAQAMGAAYGIAHLFKALGLQEYHRELRKSLSAYMAKK